MPSKKYMPFLGSLENAFMPSKIAFLGQFYNGRKDFLARNVSVTAECFW
jgi:hypothetical protein